MQVSPTPSEPRCVGAARTDGSPVGCTPLLRLRHSGDGKVLLKLESRQGSGSYWDRVAAAQLAALAGSVAVAVVGLHAHSIAVAAAARSSGRAVFMVASSADEPRLRALTAAYGPAVVDAVPLGATLLHRDDQAAHRAAFAAWRRELGEAHAPGHTLLVLPAFAGLADAVDAAERVVWVEDDGERRRQLGADAACRRTQVAHREGLLLSPLGAELVDAGVAAAVSGADEVVVLVPEGGQRHLGWW